MTQVWGVLLLQGEVGGHQGSGISYEKGQVCILQSLVLNISLEGIKGSTDIALIKLVIGSAGYGSQKPGSQIRNGDPGPRIRQFDLQSLTQKKSNFASEKAKLSCLAGWLSFALPQAKLLFFCVKDCKILSKMCEMTANCPLLRTSAQ